MHFYQTMKKNFSPALLIHIGLWFLFGLYLIFISNESPLSLFNISNVLIALLFFAIFVYFNTFYLVPNFLRQRSFITYILLFLTFALLLTPVRNLVFYLKFWGHPELQIEALNGQIFTFLSFVIVGAISTLFKILFNWITDQQRLRELERENLQSELKFLRSQINPHFLFNTLNSLYALSLKKSDLAPDMIIRLSEIMRYMLYDCNEPKVFLEKEINFMGNYIELEKLRYGEDVKIEFSIEGDASNQKITPLLFAPFFENAFKHGLGNRIGQGYIQINFTVEEENITLLIRNSIPGSPRKTIPKITKSKISKSGGIGLENVKRRLELLYPNNHYLNIHESTDEFEIELQLNL